VRGGARPRILVVDDQQGLRQLLCKLLEREGFLAVAIRPPTVPENTARLRFTFTASHTEADVARLADVVRTKILNR